MYIYIYIYIYTYIHTHIHNKHDSSNNENYTPLRAARALAEELGAHFLETSARSAHNVDEAFELHLPIYHVIS